MTDTATSTPTAPSSAASTPATTSADDTALFGKFTAQHEAALASEARHAHASKEPVRSKPTAASASAAVPAPARAAGDDPRAVDAGADGDDDASGSGDAPADDAAAPEKAADAELTEAGALALLRQARDDGDTDALDRALKVLLPGSKGLAEFNVDGGRYAEFRTTAKRAQKKLDDRAAQLSTREANLERGKAVLEGIVQRLTPLEALITKAERGDPDAVDAMVEFVEKASKRKFNDIAKLHLDKKLGKQVDPVVAELERRLKETDAKLEARERKEQEARDLQAQTQQIQGHLKFLHQTLTQSEDGRVRALVSTNEGMRAIFEAQRDHYDQRTNRTLTAEQAAKYVLDQKTKELEPWQRVLGGGKPAPALPPAETKPPASSPRATPLGRTASASGPGGRALSDNELFEKFERLHKLAGD